MLSVLLGRLALRVQHVSRDLAAAHASSEEDTDRIARIDAVLKTSVAALAAAVTASLGALFLRLKDYPMEDALVAARTREIARKVAVVSVRGVTWVALDRVPDVQCARPACAGWLTVRCAHQISLTRCRPAVTSATVATIVGRLSH